MGLLSRLRAWLIGSDETASEGTEPEAPGEDETPEEPRLDPENVTEVRTGSADDPVEKLREVKRKGSDDGDGDDDGDGEED